MVPGAVAGPAAFSRASVSRVSQIVRMDRAASAITSWVEWISASVRGRARDQSSSMTIRVSGVRSSWDSSPVSCCSWRRTVRMRSSNVSNEVPSRASSAGCCSLPKRSAEPTALHCAAWSVIVRTGRRARPTDRRVRTYVQPSITASRTSDPSSRASAELRYGVRSSAVTTVAVARRPWRGCAHSRTGR
ncbi:hypothetical protein AMK32_29020 [Streptomyces sp. CB01883]|nr:hypothetical protein AMK32_29020 [Streptomyces sp. CB01883]